MQTSQLLWSVSARQRLLLGMNTTHIVPLDTRRLPVAQGMSSCISTGRHSPLRPKARLHLIMTAPSSWRSFCEMKSQVKRLYRRCVSRDNLWGYTVGQIEPRRNMDMTKQLSLGGRHAGIGGFDGREPSWRRKG